MGMKPQDVLRNFLKCENKCEVKPKDPEECIACDYHWEVEDFKKSFELAIEALEKLEIINEPSGERMTKEQIALWCSHHFCNRCKYNNYGKCTICDHLIDDDK